MSINKKKVSNTKGNRALNLFIDRNHLIKHFAEYINDDPVTEKILYFCGNGGNGKSLLLKYLRTKCCNLFDKQVWQEILREQDLKQLADCIAIPNDTRNYVRVPALLHDFGVAPKGDEQPKDPFYGLLMLRRNIGTEAKKLKYKLHFPRFDFACVWYLHQKRRLSKEKYKELFPEEEFEFVIQLIDAFSKIPGIELADAVLDLILERLGNSLYVIWQQRGLKKEDIEEIREMDLDTELTFELPQLLAQDLNAAMSQDKSPERLVLFFDTHEAFWGSQRYLGNSDYFGQDRWLRYVQSRNEVMKNIQTSTYQIISGSCRMSFT